jgi:hypothetical protein
MINNWKFINMVLFNFRFNAILPSLRGNMADNCAVLETKESAHI